MTAMLASVRSPIEARVALAGGADLIDLKEPARGALGALDLDTVAAVIAAVAGARPVSATTGDPGAAPAFVAARARALAGLGVDFVKAGLAGSAADARLLDALAPLAASGIALVAVLPADAGVDPAAVGPVAAAGWRGIMLDTADKNSGSLRARVPSPLLAEFVVAARTAGLLVGLAGSLAREDVAPLLDLRPDYLGFRGALCAGGARAGALEAAAVAAVRALIPASPRAPGARSALRIGEVLP